MFHTEISTYSQKHFHALEHIPSWSHHLFRTLWHILSQTINPTKRFTVFPFIPPPGLFAKQNEKNTLQINHCEENFCFVKRGENPGVLPRESESSAHPLSDCLIVRGRPDDARESRGRRGGGACKRELLLIFKVFLPAS